MLILDRFEENLALIEGDEGIFSVERTFLADDVQEGDVLTLGENGQYLRDAQATRERRDSMRTRLARLRKNK